MSARFLVFSDFHAHNFVEGSTRVPHYEGIPGLFNSRLIDACKALNEIREYAVKNDVPYVLFGGDLFHSRTKVDVDVLNLIREEFVKMSNSGIRVICIPGNHDYADKEGLVHSLNYLEDIRNLQVLSSRECTLLNGVAVEAISYNESKSKLLEDIASLPTGEDKTRIFLGHFGIQGATVGSDYVMVNKQDLSINDINTEDYVICLFGHYHEHQKLNKNSWYIGATFQHNWGDANTKRGFLDISIKDNEIEFINQIEINTCVTYHTLELKSKKDLKITPKPKGLIKVTGPADLCAKFVELNKDNFLSIQTLPDSADAVESPEELPESTIDPLNMVDFWVDLHDSADANELKAIGRALLSKAIGDKL